MMKKAYCRTLRWEDIRSAILQLDESDRGRMVGLETRQAILSRRTEKLPKRLLRELSILFHGYMIGESVERENQHRVA